MRFRGLRLIAGGEGRQSHGGSLALSARITRRFRQASLPGKSPDLQPIPLPFPGRKEMYTWSPVSLQGFRYKKFLANGVSGKHAGSRGIWVPAKCRPRRLTCMAGNQRLWLG